MQSKKYKIMIITLHLIPLHFWDDDLIQSKVLINPSQDVKQLIRRIFHNPIMQENIAKDEKDFPDVNKSDKDRYSTIIREDYTYNLIIFTDSGDIYKSLTQSKDLPVLEDLPDYLSSHNLLND